MTMMMMMILATNVLNIERKKPKKKLIFILFIEFFKLILEFLYNIVVLSSIDSIAACFRAGAESYKVKNEFDQRLSWTYIDTFIICKHA
jgi:hypothetical protein